MSLKNNFYEEPIACCNEFKVFSKKFEKDISNFKICPFCGKEVNTTKLRNWWITKKGSVVSEKTEFTRIATNDIMEQILYNTTFNWDLYIEKKIILELHSDYDFNEKERGHDYWMFIHMHFMHHDDKTDITYRSDKYDVYDYEDNLGILGVVLSKILSHISSDSELYEKQLEFVKKIKCCEALGYNSLRERIENKIKIFKTSLNDINHFVDNIKENFLNSLPDDVKLLLEI